MASVHKRSAREQHFPGLDGFIHQCKGNGPHGMADFFETGKGKGKDMGNTMDQADRMERERMEREGIIAAMEILNDGKGKGTEHDGKGKGTEHGKGKGDEFIFEESDDDAESISDADSEETLSLGVP